MTYEIKLANDKSLSTNSSFELANFYASGGCSLLPLRPKSLKRTRKGKNTPVKVG
jgi:hypothetical protein